ncbi:hypothetical protein C2845_PM18G14060 [Panicum miliaceum]|uniref:Uncharacterized protein n=1 Tax=Panicum miliaceum TaxID=4540 RepID=A0A3L6PIS0_PANMI|nr:hypothetical protein C2845_PM18G14060 [Panicum miliaceum]
MTPQMEKTASKDTAVIPPARTPARAFARSISTPRHMHMARHSRTTATTALPGRHRRRTSTRHDAVTPPPLCSPPAAPTLTTAPRTRPPPQCQTNTLKAPRAVAMLQGACGCCSHAQSVAPSAPQATTSLPRATSTADASASAHARLGASSSSTPVRSRCHRADARTLADPCAWEQPVRRCLMPGSRPPPRPAPGSSPRPRPSAAARAWVATPPTGEAQSHRQRAEPSRVKAGV